MTKVLVHTRSNRVVFPLFSFGQVGCWSAEISLEVEFELPISGRLVGVQLIET